MNIYNDLRKIKRQLWDEENHFGFKTKLANKLYLLYCFLGVECYRTDKLHQHTKYLFGLWHCVEWMIITAITVAYVLFEQKNDFIMFMNVIYFTGGLAFLRIISPVLSLWFGKNIEKFIAYVDATSSPPIEPTHQGVTRININGMLKRFAIALSVSLTLHASTGFVDALLFFEPEKLRDDAYYAIPMPQIHRYGCWSVFLGVNISGIIVFAIIALELCAFQGISIIWAAFSHNRVSRIGEDLANASKSMQIVFENPIATSSHKQYALDTFEHALLRCVNDYQRVIQLVRTFEKYFIVSSSLTLSLNYVINVVHVYRVLSDDISYMLKLKELCMAITAIQITYNYFRVGDVVYELSAAMSFQVYSTPWYLSTRIRKDVYIFLCQCQHEITFKALNVYFISLRSFMRFLNGIYSTVNLLRRVVR